MIQETRKDPRAKVLSMTVRYKSATIDEFIEHHSHDVSRGGMFIKTPSPFPAGTLLKFEVRIADEKKVMQGVGRVVWKRDASGASPDSPAGMGVKFIKLDEESKAVIDRLIGNRGDKEGAYDVGERTSQSGAGPAPEGSRPLRKGTMIGLGAMKPAEVPRRSSNPPPPAAEETVSSSNEGFFPSGPPMEQPAPEDRTMMKQAAELLRDALREAGGSMDEIGSTGVAPVIASPHEKEDEARHVSDAPKPRTSEPTTAPAPRSDPPAAVVKAKSVAPPAPVAKPASVPPRKVERPLPSSVPAPPAKSGPKPALMLLGVAAIGGGLFWLTQQNKPAESPPTPSAQAEPAAVAPPPTPEPIASEAPAAASAEPPASAAPSAAAKEVEETKEAKAARLKAEATAKKAEEDAAKKAADDAKKAEAAAKKAEDADAKKAADDAKKAADDAKKAAAAAAAAAAPKPAPAKPKPKPVASVTGEAPSEDKPPATDTKPAEKPPAGETKPAEKPVAPAPAPVPGPKAPESDNPY